MKLMRAQIWASKARRRSVPCLCWSLRYLPAARRCGSLGSAGLCRTSDDVSAVLQGPSRGGLPAAVHCVHLLLFPLWDYSSCFLHQDSGCQQLWRQSEGREEFQHGLSHGRHEYHLRTAVHILHVLLQLHPVTDAPQTRRSLGLPSLPQSARDGPCFP
ncbi:uncharacterized protein LOC128597295 isoform X1 [Nycticebus coucang]|uniref:uncharacterized protein LOC128597295 isoform X1 n=1 Tax=Nycticebus coucang TaxID=9470 RepID=UPI00234C11EE|nr:uncharacterized protein LOC128597295 isoform X1 [Nycticebus coucang]